MGKNESPHEILKPAEWPRPRGYSNGIRAFGEVIVTGGVVGWDESEQLADGFLAQAGQAFKNIVAILREGGARPEHLVRMTWYVCDINEYLEARKDLRDVYMDIIGPHLPAMALVAVCGLVEQRARLEIEATAVVPYNGAPGS